MRSAGAIFLPVVPCATFFLISVFLPISNILSFFFMNETLQRRESSSLPHQSQTWRYVFLKLINNSSRENKENHHRDRGLDM